MPNKKTDSHELVYDEQDSPVQYGESEVSPNFTDHLAKALGLDEEDPDHDPLLRFSVSIRASVVHDADDAAKRLGLTRSAYISMVLDHFYNQVASQAAIEYLEAQGK